jgi:NAD(P)-dependent dehydrogenase (short-subunit alcohol dehydrogenase family)
MRVAGKMAFVTGGASGLGRASSLMLAKEGAKVAVTDINAEGAAAVAAEINAAYPGQGFAYQLDVTHEENWKAALQAAHDDMGGLNVLLNNAGIGGGSTVEDTDFATWKSP